MAGLFMKKALCVSLYTLLTINFNFQYLSGFSVCYYAHDAFHSCRYVFSSADVD